MRRSRSGAPKHSIAPTSPTHNGMSRGQVTAQDAIRPRMAIRDGTLKIIMLVGAASAWPSTQKFRNY